MNFPLFDLDFICLLLAVNAIISLTISEILISYNVPLKIDKKRLNISAMILSLIFLIVIAY